MLRQCRKESIVIITLLALTGSFSTDPSAKTDFMEKFGPEYAHRIALTRDANGEIQVIFSNDGGPERDDATEIIQATKFLDDDGKQSFLIMMQRSTEKLGAINEDDMAKVVGFLGTYFEGQETDVFLAAKSDRELDGNTVTWYASIKGETITASQVDKVNDFVATDNGVYLLVGANIGKIDAKILDANLDGTTESVLHGANKIIAVSQGIKLARGPKLELAPGEYIDTAAYVKDEDGTAKMILLDSETLDEVKVIDLGSDYATAGHDDTIVLVIDVQNVGDEDETFDVSRRPAAEMFAAA